MASINKQEQTMASIVIANSGVAYKERLNQPVIAEQVSREQPEHLREYFMERVRYYREQSIQLPRAYDPRYIEMAEQNTKK
ncbi:TPA: DNA polymerase III subunit theta [Klebsiella michiganensis]